jgi:hypothetical protein
MNGTEQQDRWPDPIEPAAYHGLAGELVKVIEPNSEADPVALLTQFHVAFGNLIGRTAHFRAEADTHYCNLFIALVGTTSKGRKGSSWGQTRRILASIDQKWCEERVMGGLSSGEGLIWAVRNAIYKLESVKEKGQIVGTQEVLVDGGVDDKRLMVLEPEFGSVLKVIGRERNTLSNIIRQAWDTGTLRTLTKNCPAHATGAHISITGHITRDELRREICETDMANGLANRFLWLCVRRSKCLPEGGALRSEDFAPIVQRIGECVEFSQNVGTVQRDRQARQIWAQVYPKLSEGRPGLLGAATSRAEAQVMRLATIYALLDRSAVVCAEHLMAALAVWEYAEQSAKYIFGSALGDPTADAILRALREHPEGMDRTAIREYFQRHKTAEEIGRAASVLEDASLVRREHQKDTGGRPREVWFACT